jgi:phosphoribosylamine--glycine ligase
VRVLVVGGGGREHALCWRLAQDPSVEEIFAAPGNAGIAEVATVVPVPAGDLHGLLDLAVSESIDLTVVGPEAPLVAGLADEIEAKGMPVFGPTREGARLEGSKAWARALCDRHGIPAPRSGTFEELAPALEYLEGFGPPVVVKADGLAAGKGVVIAQDRQEAEDAVRACIVDDAFGEAGRRVVIEEFLQGREVSALALTDGEGVVPLALAHDYKRALDGDAGLNTGGMGAHSPVPWVDADTEKAIVDDVLRPTVQALGDEGIRYRGCLYAGLMLTAGGPKVLEFNARFGDPETQVLVRRIHGDLAALLLSCAEGGLGSNEPRWAPEVCVGVVLASGGYPGGYETGKPISGLEVAGGVPGVQVFHGGTTRRQDRVVTAGGRVLTVAALGADIEQARRRAYEAASMIHFEGMAYRQDIGADVPVHRGLG